MVTAWNIAKFALLIGIGAGLLGYGMERAELGAVIGDPVGGIRAQDETTYANSALHLATDGGWLTPKVMGRLYLIKPPLLLWLSGLSLKTLGISRLALRLPVLLAAVLATVLIFLWAEKHSRGAAVLAGLLAAGNPLWHTYSRVCYTDMLLALAIIAAFFVLRRDPGVVERRTVVLFAACTAMAVMVKNVAGFIPVMVLLVSLVIGRRRIPWRALLQMLLIAVLLILPWHAYQLLTNSRWFLADYVYFQLFRSGVTPPAQSSEEGQMMFYLKRLWLMDPLLCLGAVLAAPSLVRAIRQRKTEATLLASWLLVAGLALLAFRFRNLPYLLYAIPALCLMAASYGPLTSGWKQRAAIAILAVAFFVRILGAGQPWGLWFGPPPALPGAGAFRDYTNLARQSELMVVDTNDEYYSSALPLPRVRYCYVDPTGAVESFVPHYNYLGITISAATFADIERWRPQFGERLRQWGLESDEPIGTAIVARSDSEVLALIATHPRSDFYLPARLRTTLEALDGSHRIVDVAPDRFFLLARAVPDHTRALPAWWKDGKRW